MPKYLCVLAGVSVSQEISRQSGGDILLLGVSFVLMCIYMIAALTSFRPSLKTRGLLGLCAVLTVVFAIAATLGFTAWFFQYNPLTVQVRGGGRGRGGVSADNTGRLGLYSLHLCAG